MTASMHRSSLVFLIAFALAGCSGGGSAAGPVVCNGAVGIVDANAALVAPAKGATGVAATIGTISFTVTVPVLQHGVLTLWVPTSAGGLTPAVTAGTISTVNGVSSASIPALAPATTYTAVVTVTEPEPAGSACPGPTDTGNLGSFTTAS
jgi:hypothetical protein